MGNISSPIITRLGIKQFWYKHWYTDLQKSFARNLGIDKTVELLLTTYLSYGLVRYTNPFINNYWYKGSCKKTPNIPQNLDLPWSRRFHYRSARFKFEYSYIRRSHSGEYFPLKLWLMRYKGWVILVINWFKPVKKSRRRRKTRRYRARPIPNSTFIHGFSQNRNPLRLKILVHMCYKLLHKSSYQYNF